MEVKKLYDEEQQFYPEVDIKSVTYKGENFEQKFEELKAEYEEYRKSTKISEDEYNILKDEINKIYSILYPRNIEEKNLRDLLKENKELVNQLKKSVDEKASQLTLQINAVQNAIKNDTTVYKDGKAISIAEALNDLPSLLDEIEAKYIGYSKIIDSLNINDSSNAIINKITDNIDAQYEKMLKGINNSMLNFMDTFNELMLILTSNLNIEPYRLTAQNENNYLLNFNVNNDNSLKKVTEVTSIQSAT